MIQKFKEVKIGNQVQFRIAKEHVQGIPLI